MVVSVCLAVAAFDAKTYSHLLWFCVCMQDTLAAPGSSVNLVSFTFNITCGKNMSKTCRITIGITRYLVCIYNMKECCIDVLCG